jgi:TPR repeat protein
MLTSAGTGSDPVVVVSEVAHIVAESPAGPRGDSPLSEPERNHYENLILLCNVHHQLIDSQPATYTVEWLMEIKHEHERWVEQRLKGIDIARPAQARRPVTAVHPQTFGTVGAITDPVLLGIHPAIPLKISVEGLDSQLPIYIRRDIDTDLRTALREDLSRGGFIVLVGRAACGKSRTAYEAIKAELSAWRIFVPAEAAEVNGLAEAEIGDGQIIVWVDELLPLLNDPDLSIRAFRELIGNPSRPVVIIGTMWPEHHDQLSEQPTQAQPDPFRAARWLLKLARRWDLPASMSEAELNETKSLSAIDPRINEAAHYAVAGQSPIAVLACAPDLISRFTTAPNSRGRLVVEAAVEARLSGHSRVVPVDLLQRLAAVRLTPEDKATSPADWFSEAIIWACQPVRGVVSLLKPYARELGVLAGYEVSDIATSHVWRSGFRHRNVQASTWELLADTTDIESCLFVGFNALQLGHIRSGQKALRRSANEGVDLAAMMLGLSYFDEGNLDEALAWLTRSYDNGESDAAALIAVVYSSRGETDEAQRWLTIAAEGGDPSAMFGLGQLHENQDDDTEAYRWYRKSIDRGFIPALSGLGGLHAKRGEHEQAISFWKRAAAAGEPMAMMNLARYDLNAGKTLGAERWWRAAAELGVVEAMGMLAEQMLGQERQEEATDWARKASEAGHAPAWGLLGQLLAQHGHVEDGLRWLTRGAEAGQVNAMGWLAEQLEDLEDLEGARRWMATLATEYPEPAIHARYGIFLHTHGHTEEAMPWIRQSLDSGDPMATRLLGIAAKADATLSEMIFPVTGNTSPLGLVPHPEQGQWTPIEQRCGCVIDWGWDQRSNPEAFMMWCVEMTAANCVWHGADSGQFPAPPPNATISLVDRRSGVAYLTRRATGDDIKLGQELTRQIKELMTSSRDDLIAKVPRTLHEHFVEEGYDPAEQWMQTRLTDIVLNRGSSIDWHALTAVLEARRTQRDPMDMPGDRPEG